MSASIRTPAEERGYTDKEFTEALAYWWSLSDDEQARRYGSARGLYDAFHDKRIGFGRMSAPLIKELLRQKAHDELSRLAEEAIASPISSSLSSYLGKF